MTSASRLPRKPASRPIERAARPHEEAIVEARTLTCDGQLIATAELADAYGYNRDWYDHVFLFKNDTGYELLVVSRRERFHLDRALDQAAARVDVTALDSAQALEEVVEARWPASTLAWWRLLAGAQEYDPDLYQLWIPERMKRDLQLFSIHDHELATKTDYVGGHALDAPGRRNDDWREEAVAAVADHLGEQSWLVRCGPELSEHVQAGRIPSFGTEVVGSLWATRYGREVALVVRVDDCGEIYARLAEPGDLVPERCDADSGRDRADAAGTMPGNPTEGEKGEDEIVRADAAVASLLNRLDPPMSPCFRQVGRDNAG